MFLGWYSLRGGYLCCWQLIGNPKGAGCQRAVKNNSVSYSVEPSHTSQAHSQRDDTRSTHPAGGVERGPCRPLYISQFIGSVLKPKGKTLKSQPVADNMHNLLFRGVVHLFIALTVVVQVWLHGACVWGLCASIRAFVCIQVRDRRFSSLPLTFSDGSQGPFITPRGAVYPPEEIPPLWWLSVVFIDSSLKWLNYKRCEEQTTRHRKTLLTSRRTLSNSWSTALGVGAFMGILVLTFFISGNFYPRISSLNCHFCSQLTERRQHANTVAFSLSHVRP